MPSLLRLPREYCLSKMHPICLYQMLKGSKLLIIILDYWENTVYQRCTPFVSTKCSREVNYYLLIYFSFMIIIMILWEILIITSVLQAATILVAMASEKHFGDQNSGESHQLATNRLKKKLNNMSWSVPPFTYFLFLVTKFFYGDHKLQLKIAKRWLFEKVRSLERCGYKSNTFKL